MRSRTFGSVFSPFSKKTGGESKRVAIGWAGYPQFYSNELTKTSLPVIMPSKLSGLSRNGLKRFDSLKCREQQLVDCGPSSRGQRIVQVLCGSCHSSTCGRTATTAKSKPDIDIPHISGEDTLYVQSTQSLPRLPRIQRRRFAGALNLTSLTETGRG